MPLFEIAPSKHCMREAERCNRVRVNPDGAFIQCLRNEVSKSLFARDFECNIVSEQDNYGTGAA